MNHEWIDLGVPNREMIFIEWGLNGYKYSGSFERVNGGQGYGVKKWIKRFYHRLYNNIGFDINEHFV